MMATALNDLGVNYRRMGLYYDGLDHHAQAVELSGGGRGEQRDKFLKCQAIGYNGIGNVHLTIGHYLSADSMLRKALAIETRLGSHLGMNVDNSNLGMVFERRGLIDSAWHYFRKAHIHSQQANSSTNVPANTTAPWPSSAWPCVWCRANATSGSGSSPALPWPACW